MRSMPSMTTLPAVAGRKPTMTSASSRWPLPATPATPTISPDRTVISAARSALLPRSPRAESPDTSRSGASGSLGGGRSVTAGEAPTIRPANCAESVSATVKEAATVSPPRSTVASSQKSVTSWSLWLMKMTDRPSSAMRRNTPPSSSASAGVSTAVGSSRIRIRASRHRALRISTRCRSPIESCQTSRSGSTASPNRAAVEATSASKAVRRSRGGAAPRTTFSATVNEGTSRNSWWTMPIPASRASAGFRNRQGRPCTRTSPSSGR